MNMKQLKLPSCILVISMTIVFGFSNRVLSKSESSLCQNLNQVKEKAAQLEKINGNSSIGQLREIQKDIFATLGELGLLREQIAKIESDQIREKVKNIDRKIENIDDDSTLNDLAGIIISEVTGMDSISNIIGSLSECKL